MANPAIILIIILSLGGVLLTGFFWYSQIQENDLQIISENSVLYEGIGFDDLPVDVFTQKDLEDLQTREKMLEQMMVNDDNNISSAEKEKIRKELIEIPVRLQNPFQTGVQYELMKILVEKTSQVSNVLVDLRDKKVPITQVGEISNDNQAIVIGIDEQFFTKSNLEKYDKQIREHLGDEINVVYKKSSNYVLEE